jgi:hypothetical protein
MNTMERAIPYIVLALSIVIIGTPVILAMEGPHIQTSEGAVTVGQIKTIETQLSPLHICPPKVVVAHLSLGVLRNGQGSVSSEDFSATVQSPEDVETLQRAAKNGDLVEVTTNSVLADPCRPEVRITAVRVLPQVK